MSWSELPRCSGNDGCNADSVTGVQQRVNEAPYYLVRFTFALRDTCGRCGSCRGEVRQLEVSDRLNLIVTGKWRRLQLLKVLVLILLFCATS
jgi:hypothetical protein